MTLQELIARGISAEKARERAICIAADAIQESAWKLTGEYVGDDGERAPIPRGDVDKIRDEMRALADGLDATDVAH